jgi:hypothetical protein
MRGRALVLAALAAALLAPAASPAPSRAPEGIRFTYTDPNAGAVSWAGAFNGWSTTANPMQKDASGAWSVVIALPPGEHEYKFVVDGQWIADPENGVTRGDMGNSVVSVGPDGEVVTAKATSNTPYSPKIFVGGRIIGLYQVRKNDQTHRFELRRPTTDIDLALDVRISDLVKARVLMNIDSERREPSETDFFRATLNYDRGHLEFNQPRFQVLAYDNDDAGTWDDPLHLLGDVGIYHHDYGYQRQGFRFTTQHWGFDTEAQYADNFETGGDTYVQLPGDAVQFLREGFTTVPGGAGYELVPGELAVFRIFQFSDGNENMLALRTRRPVTQALTLGLLGRIDRGFNLGSIATAEVVSPTHIETLEATAEQEWLAGGGELRWKAPGGFELFGEVLRGATRLVPVTGTNVLLEATAIDSTGIQDVAVISTSDATGDHRTIDKSTRFRFGAAWEEAHGDIRLTADVEHQSHAYEIIYHGLENSMTIWRASWDRNWRYYLNREVKTGVAIEYTDFTYDPATPWSYQMWFPFGNFWLEHGEHVVSVDRMVMLGGDDVISTRPSLEIPWWGSRNGLVRWNGVFNCAGLRVPKYAESIFRVGLDLTRLIRLNTDSRWVKYDDPVLGLHDGFVDHFLELDYRFAPSISLALSFGVDPYVIDPATNDWAYIGRDLFLFERGANGSVAESNYYGLGQNIAAAEKALRDERRFQIKGTVNF